MTTAVTDLARDPRFISILRAVILDGAPSAGAQALANVAHGVGDLVGKLGADPRGAVSTETSIGPGEWERLVRAMSDRFAVDSARLDRELNAQEVANAYNGATAWFPTWRRRWVPRRGLAWREASSASTTISTNRA